MQDIINNLFEKANAIGGNVLIADKEGIKEQLHMAFNQKKKTLQLLKILYTESLLYQRWLSQQLL